MQDNQVVHEITQLSLFTDRVSKAWETLVNEKNKLKAEKAKIREIKKNDAEHSKLRDAVKTDREALKAREEALRKDYSIDAIDAEIKEAKLKVEDAEAVLSESIVALRKVSPQETISIGGSDKKIKIKATLVNT